MPNDECLICGSPLEYLENEITMECAICHSKSSTRTRCAKGHFVCDSCHTQGMDNIIAFCMKETSKDPIDILDRMMDLPFCHMHGNEHHVMAGCALVTAFCNAGGKANLSEALKEVVNRGRNVPGGVCGFYGACGSAISMGIAMAVITGSTPLKNESYGMANTMTSKALAQIGQVGGPRCCKRNCYLSIQEAVKYIGETLGVKMETHQVTCRRSRMNNQCIGTRCPFFR